MISCVQFCVHFILMNDVAGGLACRPGKRDLMFSNSQNFNYPTKGNFVVVKFSLSPSLSQRETALEKATGMLLKGIEFLKNIPMAVFDFISYCVCEKSVLENRKNMTVCAAIPY